MLGCAVAHALCSSAQAWPSNHGRLASGSRTQTNLPFLLSPHPFRVAGFVAERRLVTENEVLEAGRAGGGLKTSFALVPGSELGPEGSGVDLSYARRAETLSTPQYRAAAAAARLDAFAPLVPVCGLGALARGV